MYYESYLQHHGVLGMKWGVRRYQNKDGSLTPKGKKRLDKKLKKYDRKINLHRESIKEKTLLNKMYKAELADAKKKGVKSKAFKNSAYSEFGPTYLNRVIEDLQAGVNISSSSIKTSKEVIKKYENKKISELQKYGLSNPPSQKRNAQS